MKGIISAFTPRKAWGFITTADGSSHFFHLVNSPGFKPILGAAVEFELAGPFRLGQPDQAVNLRAVESVGGGAV